jgi:hypothetical protein
MDQRVATSTVAESSSGLSTDVTRPDVGSPPRTVSEYLDALPLNRRHCTVCVVSALGFFFDALDLQILALAVPSKSGVWRQTQSAGCSV